MLSDVKKNGFKRYQEKIFFKLHLIYWQVKTKIYKKSYFAKNYEKNIFCGKITKFKKSINYFFIDQTAN